MAMERNSDNPLSPPDQDFMELKWESNALLMQANRNNNVRYLVESDSVKSLANNSMKIVNFPHLARLASRFDPTRQGIGSDGVATEIRSNKRVAEEEIGNNGEISNKKMKMKINEENINNDVLTEFADHRLAASVAASNNAPAARTGVVYEDDFDSGCSSDQDEHGEMEADASTTVDYKRSRYGHRDQRKRKDKMKKKILALQELLPGCNKVVDKASVLDDAIEYVKTLQHQLQIMSIAHLFTPTSMMIPSVTSQLMMPTLNQFSSPGMGLGMGSGFGLGHVPINPQVSAMPGFAPMPCVMPYGPGVGEGAGTRRWGTTTLFDHHQLGSNSSVPPLSSYNDSNKPEDFSENRGLVPKPKDK